MKNSRDASTRRAVLLYQFVVDHGAYHWYDFLCPFCYVAQHCNAILASYGLVLVELPFEAHPDIPPGRAAAEPRTAATYRTLERDAAATGAIGRWRFCASANLVR